MLSGRRKNYGCLGLRGERFGGLLRLGEAPPSEPIPADAPGAEDGDEEDEEAA